MKGKNDEPLVTLRLLLSPSAVIGPGKVALLEAIGETGSISAAGRRHGMSYKRAWHLVEALNSHFTAPLVETSKGGKSGGGAALTDLGRDVIAAYRGIEGEARKAAKPHTRRLRRHLRSGDDR